jgi:CheY-like chemotaxis protein/HPt (histidine-containing phosphotransfer) domain-containing protein
MSHEIRSPMNVIAGLTEMLLEEDEPIRDLKKHLKQIKTANDILLLLINDILDISKIESGKLTLTPVEYSTANMLNDIISLNLLRFQGKPISFKLEFNDGELFECMYGDDLRVGQILNNILCNAFKYTKEGSITLRVNCERENENILLSFSVSDTGIGIRKEDISKLFDDYNQVDTEANRKIEGTGLGLSITKGLIDLIGGKISVESDYGKGTTFHVKLRQGFVNEKIIGAEIAEALRNFSYLNKKANEKKLERPNLSHVTVLVVDDYLPNLDVAKWILGKYNMKIDCASSGEEAVEKIKLNEYDAVFMDYMMPGMDGIETTRLIRADEKDLPIIALTADAIEGSEQMFLQAGFQAFLTKPINISSLDAVIRKWITRGVSDFSYEKTKSPPQKNEPAVSRECEIAGINVKYGLSLYDDDMEMFLDITRSFAEDIPEELEKLREVSEETLRAYAINVHTVKGCAAGIGAKKLSDKAFQLEQMAKSNNLSGILQENDEFIKSAYALVKDIRAWFDEK